MLTPLLILHISSAVIGLLAGFMAMFFRKGSGLHGAAGTVFFVSMLSMTTSAFYIAAFLRPVMINVVASSLTFYLVTTSWRAARNREGKTGLFDRAALLFGVGVGLAALRLGLEAAAMPKRSMDGVPAPVFFFFGAIALLCAVWDVRMLVRGGVTGARRIGRHLWRMSLALLIATLSFYPGQAKLFPRWLRDTNLLFIPMVLVIGSMFFWLYRVSVRKRMSRNTVIPATHDASITTLAA